MSLLHEKDYDAIVVKEILDRADVGRSTFYTHFRDKDDLLASGIHEMLGLIESARPPSSRPNDKTGNQTGRTESARRESRLRDSAWPERVLWFSLPIFKYHHQHQRGGEVKMGARGRAIVHGHLQRVITQLIADDVRTIFQGRESFQGRQRSTSPVPADLIVQHIASTFILVLDWWLRTRSPFAPDQVDGVFRSLVLPSLG